MCKRFLSYLFAIFMTLILFIFYIIYILPENEPIEINRSELRAQAKKRARAIRHFLTDDILEDREMFDHFQHFIDDLINATTKNITIDECKNENLMKLAYNRLDLISNRCSETHIRRVIFYLLSLIREMIIVGREPIFECRMQELINVIESCGDIKAFELVMNVIMMSVDFQKGGLCLQSYGRPLFNFVNTLDYGKQDWQLMSLFSIWAERMGGLREDDLEAMCLMLGRQVKNRALWDIDIKQQFCWLASHIPGCVTLKAINLEKELSSPECVDFLKTTIIPSNSNRKEL